jgi:hypothetical protein
MHKSKPSLVFIGLQTPFDILQKYPTSESFALPVQNWGPTTEQDGWIDNGILSTGSSRKLKRRKVGRQAMERRKKMTPADNSAFILKWVSAPLHAFPPVAHI